ncbi:amidase domain-containing protein [Microterricola viridarii]|uniref:Putative amidase domain-containing protein n=1 Tax=Microterricola viridarii TaxID=412690 RepID=A0A1H1MM06_9MICO|nr:amidase domain-containing protein [Microterricola viridarii]SDR87415.1 Putative amidase domain-containing protein [Microterricola viridarii]
MPRPRWFLPTALLALLTGTIVAGVAILPGLGEAAPDAGIAGLQSAAPSQERAGRVDAAPEVQAQLDYVHAHWDSYNTAEYGVLDDNDCVNFTSQSLVERGWEMDEEWWTEGTGMDFDYTPAWVSSTAFMNYLDESGRATALSDEQRSEVKLGDVAQFDWDNSGDRDHTAVVTAIEGSGDDIQIFYGGHTDDTDFRSVDEAITEIHPGASVYYWSIP